MAYQPYNPYLYQPTFQQPAPAVTQTPSVLQGNVVQPGFSCRPVTSREEATAVQVDFFGPGTIMPDLGHGIIYLKRFNSQTGACDIFEFAAQQTKEPEPIQYATKEDLQALREEIEKLKDKKVKKNDDE